MIFSMVTSSPDYIIYEDVAVSVHHHSQWLFPRLQRKVVGVVVGLLSEAGLIVKGCGESARRNRMSYLQIII